MTTAAVPAIPLVTEADVIHAWFKFYARPEGLEHVEVLGPDHPNMKHASPELTLAALRRVLEADRLRVIDQLTPSGS